MAGRVGRRPRRSPFGRRGAEAGQQDPPTGSTASIALITPPPADTQPQDGQRRSHIPAYLQLRLFILGVAIDPTCINPAPPSDAVRQQKKIFLRIFSVQYCLSLKNITPLETLNFII